MGDVTPDVSVIVISYNDADRLPRAIRSVQQQTLRDLEIIVIDDASTDDTEAVVRALAAADPRIRYERLPLNSGGCSGPRNRGMDLARAPWVMFCDSDDEYERHAGKNLLLAAERLDADVVCGTAERVDVRTGRSKRWRPEVHEREQVADALDEFPELIFDTISVNKIYRREMLVLNGIRFPEGLLFEDQLFTLEAFASARRVAAIPETVYRWNVDRLSEELSITQRRNEVRNVDSRIEINRRIDSFLLTRGLASVQALKDLKFLRHDLYLYLSSILEVDDATAQSLMDRLIPYVSTVNLAPAWDVRPALRVAVYHLLVNDLAGVRSAMRFVKWAAVVDVVVVPRDGREFWGSEHLDDGVAVGGIDVREWLDVTDLRLGSYPLSQRRWCHVMATLRGDGRRLVASGTTVDPFGSLDRVADAAFVMARGSTIVAEAPLRLEQVASAKWRWHVDAPLRGLPAPRVDSGEYGSFALRLTIDGVVNLISVRSPAAAVPRVDLPGIRRSLELRTSPGDHGVVRWRAGRYTRSARALGRLRDIGESVMKRLRGISIPFLRRLGAALPARQLAVFSSRSATAYSGQPRAISSALGEQRPRIRQVWVRADAARPFPPSVRTVREGTVRHSWALARGRWWIDDEGHPMSRHPAAHTTYAHALEGIPLARIGRDNPNWDITPKGSRIPVAADVRRWSVLLSPSAAFAERIPLAIGYDGRLVSGSPFRESILARAADRMAPTGLDLPGDRVIVLYAPLRDEVSFDMAQVAGELGDRVHLLVMSGSGRPIDVPPVLRYGVRDVSEVDDRAALLAASDAVITDFSPWLLDFARLGRPIIIHSPDFDAFVSRTAGTYVDLAADGPGPITRTTPELVAQLVDLLDHDLQVDPQYAARARRFAQLGQPLGSAADVIEGIFGSGRGE